MKPTIFQDQYIMIEPDGTIRFDTVTDELVIALSQHLADSVPSSIKERAIKAGFKIIRCDIILTNVKQVTPNNHE